MLNLKLKQVSCPSGCSFEFFKTKPNQTLKDLIDCNAGDRDAAHTISSIRSVRPSVCGANANCRQKIGIFNYNYLQSLKTEDKKRHETRRGELQPC